MNDWKERLVTQSKFFLQKRSLTTFRDVAECFNKRFNEMLQQKDLVFPDDGTFMIDVYIVLDDDAAEFFLYDFSLELYPNEKDDEIVCYKGKGKTGEVQLHRIVKRNGSYLINEEIIDDLFRRAYSDFLEYDWGYKLGQ